MDIGAQATVKQTVAAPARRRGLLFVNRRLLALGFLAACAGGFALRAAEVWRPIDFTSTSPWRECDMGMIARNFWRGDMNILYPQIDWRGDGPGYVESELPLLSWLMAAGYRLFGYHEEIGRVLVLLVSLGSVWAFFGLARALLPPLQAYAATVFYLFSPLLIQLATNIQPDPGMLLCSILCVHAFVRWLRAGRDRDLALCALTGALAILFKAPAASLGLLFAALCFEKFGWRAALRPRVWLLAAAMLLPGLIWYHHARGFWLAYGNSLGLSNEKHWLGADLLRQPRELLRLLATMLHIEAKQVFGYAGLLLAALGAARAWRGGRLVLYWLAAVYAFYLVALHTTGRNWAFYYHALSVAPACLLLGLGCAPRALLRLRGGAGRARLVQGAALACLGLLGLQSVHYVDFLPSHRGDPVLRARYLAARQFAPRIQPDERVVTVGWVSVDEYHRPVAYDDGTLIYFLDRQGFIIPRDKVGVAAALRGLARRGARYFIEKRDSSLAAEARREFNTVAIAGEYELFALNPLDNPAPRPGGAGGATNSE